MNFELPSAHHRACCAKPRESTAVKAAATDLRKPAWSAREEMIMRDFYPETGARAVARMTRRPLQATYKKAQAMGMRRSELHARTSASNPARTWTAAELQAVKARYMKEGAQALALELGRSTTAIYAKAFITGVTLGRPTGRRERPLGAVREYSIGNGRKRTEVRVAMSGERSKDWKRLEVVDWERQHGPVPQGFSLMVPSGMEKTAANCRLVKTDDVPLLAARGRASAEERELITLKSRFGQRLARIERLNGITKQPAVRSTAWADVEIHYLLSNHAMQSAGDIGRHLGRSAKGVLHQLRKRGLSGTPGRAWKPTELRTLVTMYPTNTVPFLANLLGRTVAAISRRVEILGLKKRGTGCL